MKGRWQHKTNWTLAALAAAVVCAGLGLVTGDWNAALADLAWAFGGGLMGGYAADLIWRE